MPSSGTCAAAFLASVASLAVADACAPNSLQPRNWDYPETVPVIERRQEPGTPRFACHENCGLLITLGRTDGYCDTSEWSTRYSACMACANDFGIWSFYSAGVTAAAQACGLAPTPSPSGAGADVPETTAAGPSSAPSATETLTEPAITTTSSAAAAPPANEQSSAVTSPPSSSSILTTTATAASSAASGSASASGTPASDTSAATAMRTTSIGTSVVIPSASPTPSTVFNGANSSKKAGFLGAVGAVGLVLAAAL